MLNDKEIHRPPTEGPFDYVLYRPGAPSFVKKGEAYRDPVFNTTIKRLTDEFPGPSESDIYGKCGFWSANGTYMYHNAPVGRHVIKTNKGEIVTADLPGNFDGSFDPVQDHIWYYIDGNRIMAYNIDDGGRTLIKKFNNPIEKMGGSVDWIDRTGRYMVVCINGRARLWNKQTDTMYAGAIPADAGDGWVGITPDGNYLVTALADRWKRSHWINHEAATVTASSVKFWNRCGGHGSFVSASDGKTYFVTFECDTTSGIWAVDVAVPQTADNIPKEPTQDGQPPLRNGKPPLIWTTWADDGHFAGVARGSLRDWVYVSIESNDDNGAGNEPWLKGWNRPFMQEIVMANVLTGEVRRLAHHRSIVKDRPYRAQPRVSTCWDGSKVAWASNFGKSGEYGDIYMVDVVAGIDTPPPPPVIDPPPTTEKGLLLLTYKGVEIFRKII